jgi:hypothetical protein
MMPPELLHTSGSGLIMYMFESLRTQLGGGKDRDAIDKSPCNCIKSDKETECM